MKFPKILLATLFVFCSSIVLAAPHKTITTYTELATSLAQGDNIKAVVDFNKCSPVANTIAGMSFSTFNKYMLVEGPQARETIATSTSVMSHTSKFGHIINYVRLRVFEDNTAELFSEFIDPKTYTHLTSSSTNCQLNNGVTLYLAETV